jgi:ribose-phosphate pyrophosphokinase
MNQQNIQNGQPNGATSFFSGGAGGQGGGEASSSSEMEDEDVNNNLRLTLVGDVKDKVCFILDDIIDDPHSFLDAARHLKVCEADRVYLVASHGILSGDALKQIEECPAVNEVRPAIHDS